MIQSLERFRAWCRRIRYSKDVKKAMEAYRNENPMCEWDACSTDIHVHHIIPVHVDPSRAADPSNMVSLGSKRCHLAIGHAGSWGTRYVRNVRTIIATRCISFTEECAGNK
jgi:hypothetical protein